jgi:hypothetical protein
MKNAIVLMLSALALVPVAAFALSAPKPVAEAPAPQMAELKTYTPKADPTVFLPEVKIVANRAKPASRTVLADNSVPCGAGFWDQKTRCVKAWR